MITRSDTRRKALLQAGQCPVCGWWFDGHQVGTGEPSSDTAPVVEWSIDARERGRCLRHACYVSNAFQTPTLETPRERHARAAEHSAPPRQPRPAADARRTRTSAATA